MDALAAKVEHTILENGFIKTGDRILVALSGGPDSVALLHLLNHFKPKYDLRLAAAHLDHAIRPKSADDMQFCKALCGRMGIRFHHKRLDIKRLAERSGLSVEEAGRHARYGYFDKLAGRFDYDRIATGHTLDDNVETVIMNMVRGSGLKGISGMPYKRGKIIRPLLDCTKDELQAFLKSRKIKYVKDPSNRSLRYARNRIRHRILPELQKLNPAVRDNLARLAAIVGEEVEFLSNLTVSTCDECLVESGNAKILLDLAKLGGYHESLRKKVIEEAFKRQSGSFASLTSETLKRVMQVLDGKSGGRAPLPDGFMIENSQGRVAIFKKTGMASGCPLVVPGVTMLPDDESRLDSRILDRSELPEFDESNQTAFLDFREMNALIARFWQNGDKIRPLGMKGYRLLSDIFIDRKIPEFDRNTIPLVVSGDKIAWIAGVMISDEFKITPRTEKVLKLKLCGR